MKPETISGQASLGSATYVPEPWRRTSRPSATSSVTALRTVVREVRQTTARSRSGGIETPGRSCAIASTMWSFTLR